MYAIIKISGKQYKVEPGMVFETDRLSGTEGTSIILEDSVLLVQDGEETTIGTPTVSGATVELEVNEHFRDKKVIVFKMKKRKRYRRKQGHRQEMTRVTVKDVSLG